MSEPLVSILIPCHNAAPWLAEAIDSALRQTWPHREIIVVDDGSTDDSASVAKRYTAAGVILLSQANRGAGAARNRALAAARGDYLQYLDADDCLHPEKIARQIQTHQTAPDAVILCGTWARFREEPASAVFDAGGLCRDSDPISWLVAKYETNAMMHPAAWLLPRVLAERAGPWDESLSLNDDGEYFDRAVLASASVRAVPGAVSHYRSGLPHSLSGRRSAAAWESAARAIDLSNGHLLARETSARTRHAAAVQWRRFIYESYPAVPELRQEAARRVSLLGGCRLLPEGGAWFQRARRILGWRLARRLQVYFARQRRPS